MVPSFPFLFLFLVLLLVMVESFLLPFRPASPSTPPSLRLHELDGAKQLPLSGQIQPLRAAESLEGSDEAGESVDPAASSAPAVPRPFVSRRVRRGPIGAAAASISNKKKKAAEEIVKTDVLPSVAASSATTTSVRSIPSSTPAVLKLSKKWACVANCGACCYLAPSERPYLMDYFDDPEDLAMYNSMTGDDGWCVHYDKAARACTVFEDRPWFCRVEEDTFGKMYGVTPPEMDKFCTSCCREQIADVYGTVSTEMTTFNMAIKYLKGATTATDDVGKKKKQGGGFGKAAQVKAQDEAAAAFMTPVVPIDPFTGEESTKVAAKADWI